MARKQSARFGVADGYDFSDETSLVQEDYKKLLKEDLEIAAVKKSPVEDITEIPKTVIKNEKPAKKAGRPKTRMEEVKIFNIAIPVSTYEKLQVVKSLHGNNMTKYINDLILADLESNKDLYDKLAALLK